MVSKLPFLPQPQQPPLPRLLQPPLPALAQEVVHGIGTTLTNYGSWLQAAVLLLALVTHRNTVATSPVTTVKLTVMPRAPLFPNHAAQELQPPQAPPLLPQPCPFRVIANLRAFGNGI